MSYDDDCYYDDRYDDDDDDCDSGPLDKTVRNCCDLCVNFGECYNGKGGCGMGDRVNGRSVDMMCHQSADECGNCHPPGDHRNGDARTTPGFVMVGREELMTLVL